MIMETDRSKSAVRAGRVGTQESWWCRWSLMIICWRTSLFLRETGLFSLFRPSTDWTRPTHIRKDNLFYFIYWFKCYTHPKNTLIDTSRIMFEQIFKHLLVQSSLHIKLTITKWEGGTLKLIFWFKKALSASLLWKLLGNLLQKCKVTKINTQDIKKQATESQVLFTSKT